MHNITSAWFACRLHGKRGFNHPSSFERLIPQIFHFPIRNPFLNIEPRWISSNLDQEQASTSPTTIFTVEGFNLEQVHAGTVLSSVPNPDLSALSTGNTQVRYFNKTKLQLSQMKRIDGSIQGLKEANYFPVFSIARLNGIIACSYSKRLLLVDLWETETLDGKLWAAGRMKQSFRFYSTKKRINQHYIYI